MPLYQSYMKRARGNWTCDCSSLNKRTHHHFQGLADYEGQLLHTCRCIPNQQVCCSVADVFDRVLLLQWPPSFQNLLLESRCGFCPQNNLFEPGDSEKKKKGTKKTDNEQKDHQKIIMPEHCQNNRNIT